MVDLVTIQIISYIAASLGVFVAAIYYILNLRSQIFSRKMANYMPVYTRFQDKEFMQDYQEIQSLWEWTDFDDFIKKYSSRKGDVEDIGKWHTVINYFHCVGSLLKRNELDVDLVSDLIQTTSVHLWEKVEPIVQEIRINSEFPRYAHGFEYLYDVMKKREQFDRKTR